MTKTTTTSSATTGIGRQIAALRRMTPKELREKYAEVFGEATRSGNKPFLIKRIAWRLQADAEGSLSQRALRRAAELAEGADLRINPSPPTRSMTSAPAERDPRLPASGSIITRDYKGGVVEVKVLDDAFEHEGEIYESLSAVARAITGSHTNGFLFFRLGEHAS